MSKALCIDNTIYTVFFEHAEVPSRFVRDAIVGNSPNGVKHYVVNFYTGNAIFSLLSHQLGCLNGEITQKFSGLSQHKHDIYFRFTVSGTNQLSLSSVIYDIPSGKLGLLIAKKLRRLIRELGFELLKGAVKPKALKNQISVFYIV